MTAATTTPTTPTTPTTRAGASSTIGAAVQRLRDALAQRPGWGRSTACAVATLDDGLRCRAVERDTVTASDLPAAFGGEASAASPAQLVRAALANCLVLGYRLRAAELGVELTSLRVTVETDSDVRGMLEPASGVAAGFTAVRYHVEVDSPAPTGTVRELVEIGDRLSPVLDMLERPQRVERTVSIRGER